MKPSSFARSVFVNCPFDDDYIPLLRPLLFTLVYLRFKPRIALERSDAGEPRISHIILLIRESGLAIHDLSRMVARRVGEVFRFNMPFELGLDLGAKHYGGGALRGKKCLILDEEPYRYQAAISDLSNSRILSHGGLPAQVVRQVRYWLVQDVLHSGPSPTEIWNSFNYFMGHLYDTLTARGFSKRDIAGLTPCELLEYMERWVGNRRVANGDGQRGRI
jgi:hypothetical protein